MTFKIDAKEQYTVITPQSCPLNAQLAAELAEQCQVLIQNGSRNFIVDLVLCLDVQSDFLEPFIELSAKHYEEASSFVLVHPPAEMLQLLKKEDAIDSLNYAPTFIEATDMVNMEILERDLFGEA
jgi:hypothetical protein